MSRIIRILLLLTIFILQNSLIECNRTFICDSKIHTALRFIKMVKDQTPPPTDQDKIQAYLYVKTFFRYLVARSYFMYAICHIYSITETGSKLRKGPRGKSKNLQTGKPLDSTTGLECLINAQRLNQIHEDISDTDPQRYYDLAEKLTPDAFKFEGFNLKDIIYTMRPVDENLKKLHDVFLGSSSARSPKEKLKNVFGTQFADDRESQYNHSEVYEKIFSKYAENLLTIHEYFTTVFEDDDDRILGKAPSLNVCNRMWEKRQELSKKIQNIFKHRGYDGEKDEYVDAVKPLERIYIQEFVSILKASNIELDRLELICKNSALL